MSGQNAHRATSHRFKIGEIVKLIPTRIGALPRNMGKGLTGAEFEITRLLPEEMHSLQYRIKDTSSGQERVVDEDSILTG